MVGIIRAGVTQLAITVRRAALSACSASRSRARSDANSAISAADRPPCFRAFWHERALPLSLFGPVDRSHGFQRRICSACCLRRFAVQPFMGFGLQKFV